MQEFEPIKITGIVEKDISKPRNDGTAGSALYNVPFQLSRRPPYEWADYFPKAWDRPSSFSSAHRPGICTVSGDRVWLNGTTLEEVEKTHRNTLLLALEETNRKYAEYEEQKLAAEEKQKKMDDAHRQKVSEVAKKIKFE